MTAFLTEVCPTCGNLRSVCSDPTVTWFPQRSICYVQAVKDATWRRTRKRFPLDHEQESLHETDGLVWGASQFDLTPEDDFFGENRSTLGAAQEADRHEGQPAQGEQQGGA